jgi:hypothetical protein
MFHIVMPVKCWDALDPVDLADLDRRAPRARPISSPDKQWN